MNIRQRSILKTLLKESSIAIDEIAEQFSVSSRTIRSDVESINNEILALFQTKCLQIKNNNIILILNNDNYVNVQNITSSDDYYLNKLSSNERISLIIFELAKSNDFITLNELAESLYVSRGTVLSDMKVVQTWCKEHEVAFISKRSHGLRIMAHEEEKRRIISELIKESVFASSINCPYDSDITNYRQFFSNVDLNILQDIVIKCEDDFDFHLSDISFEGLIIHIALVVERNIQEEKNEIENADLFYDAESVEFCMATEIIKQVENLYLIELPMQEILYVAAHIKGRNINVNLEKDEKWFAMQFVVFRFMKAVLLDLEIDVNNEDQLLQGLINHLISAQIRIQNNQMIQNPLLDMLKHDYASIFIAVRHRMNYLFHEKDLNINDGEIAYIVLHFAAAIERSKHVKKNIPKIVIACASGAGTSQLLFTNIMELFDFHIVGVTSIHKLNKVIENAEVDLIISTVELKTHIPYIVTTPFLRYEDITSIQKKLESLGFIETYMKKQAFRNSDSSLVHEVMKAVNEYSVHQSEIELRKSLLQTLEQIQDDDKGEVSKKLSILDILKPIYIRLDVIADTWEEAISQSGQLLMNAGCITEAYIEESIQNVRKFGPYIVLGKGVAMPHANSTEKVNKTSMSMIRLRNPINFDKSTLGQVRYVFMLASVDEKEHLTALSDFMELLDNEEFYTLLRVAESPDELNQKMRQLLCKEN